MDRFVGTGSVTDRRQQWKLSHLASVASTNTYAYPASPDSRNLTGSLVKKRLHYYENPEANMIPLKPSAPLSNSGAISRDIPDIPCTVPELEHDNVLNSAEADQRNTKPSYVTFENHAKFQIPIVAQVHNTITTSLANNNESIQMCVLDSNDEDVFINPTHSPEVGKEITRTSVCHILIYLNYLCLPIYINS